MVVVSPLHTVIQRTKLLPFHGYTLPQGLRILLWSSIQLVDTERVWRIVKRFLVSSHGNYMYNFCPIPVGPNGFICPHLSAKRILGNSLWASRRKWTLLKIPAQSAFLTTKYIFHCSFLAQKTCFLQARQPKVPSSNSSCSKCRISQLILSERWNASLFGDLWAKVVNFRPPPSHTLV